MIFESNKIEKGTKVNNATSFVMNMLKKKHKKTKMPHKALQDFTFEHKNSPQKSKILQSFSPAQTVIKEKSKNKTLKSIYLMYSKLGFTKNAEIIANKIEITKTISFFTKEKS